MAKKRRQDRSSAATPHECFWQLTGKARYDHLHLWCEDVMKANRGKAGRCYRYACAYDGITLGSHYAAISAAYDDSVWDAAEVPITVNTVRRMVKTFVSKSAGNDNPAPQMTSNDGTFEQRLAAELIDETLMAEYELPHGQFASIHELNRHGVEIAACSTGQYWVFPLPGNGKVEAELDDGLTIGVVRTGTFGRILTLCRTVWRDPEWLIVRYPGKAADILANIEQIDSGHRFAETNAISTNAIAKHGTKNLLKRLVRVHQGWRVQVDDDNPGCQTFCLKDGTMLEDSVWEHDEPPGDSWEFERELDGEGGVSLTHTVYRMFMRRNEVINDQDRAQHNMPQVAFLCQKGTGEAEAANAQLQGAQGVKIIEITGNVNSAIKAFEMPNLAQAGQFLSEMYRTEMHNTTGIAENQANGTRTPGTTSGLHESLTASYYTENFADAERRLIQFRAVTQARKFIWALQSVVENKYSRWVGDSRKKRQITEKDLDLDDSKYTLNIKPASEEKDSPKSRLEKAERLLQDPAGRFTGADLVETWKTYDEKAAEHKAYAAEDWTEEQCSKWLKLPEEDLRAAYQSPSKWMMEEGLKAAMNTCWYNYVRAREEGAPQTRLKYFEQFNDECFELIQQAEQRAAELQAQATGRIPAPQQGAPTNVGAGAGPAPGG